MYSKCNGGKSVVAERFIRTLKNKIFKHMVAISKNVYLDVWDDIVNPIRSGLSRGIKSWGGGHKKPHPWKPSSDCQNALKFGLSNIWDIPFV